MALPVIIVDSASGSDTAASGAGPGDGTTGGAALTGSAASTSATGLVVTLDGAPDLTPVATDGSHVIFLNDTTAAARNFGKITAKDNSAKTVTVSNAFGLSLAGKSWAIGGKRASVFGTISRRLFNLDVGAADMDALDWAIEMQSGHTETVAAAVGLYAAKMTMRGKEGAAVKPVITFSNDGSGFQMRGTEFTLDNFNLTNSYGTPTNGIGIGSASGGAITSITRMKVSNFYDCIGNSNNGGWSVTDSEISGAQRFGIDAGTGIHVRGCYVHNNASHGIHFSGFFSNYSVYGSLITGNGGYGIHDEHSGGSGGGGSQFWNNTIYGNTGGGIYLYQSFDRTVEGGAFFNNIVSNNSGYGIFVDNAGTAIGLYRSGFLIRNNAFYANSSGNINITYTFHASNQIGVDPQFTNAAGGDFSIGSNLKSLGFPTAAIGSGGS